MAIKVGDKIPSVSLKYMDKDGMQTVKTDDLFKGKKVVLFALPGAFTPTCSAYALDAIAEHGVAKGLVLALRRLGRCHPISWLGGSSGFDPVPRTHSPSSSHSKTCTHE